MTAANSPDRREWVMAALDEYEDRLRRYAARLCGDEEAARDVVQHAFLRLCDQNPAELDGRLGPWLFAVCKNKALDYLRAKSSGRTTPLDAERTEPPETGRGPADSAERGDMYLFLLQLIERLPSAQREAIELWTQGCSYREIAQMTDKSEGSVRVLVHRALLRLRENPQVRRVLAEETVAP